MTRLFGASWCPGCRQAKDFLDKHKFEYIYIDVDKEENRELVLDKEIRSIPVLEVGVATIVGFSAEKYEKLFKV